MVIVLVVTWLPSAEKIAINTAGIYATLIVYSGYILILEMASRVLRSGYDRKAWRVGRIVANVAMVSALLWFSEGGRSYFWFLYLLPIFQAIIYLYLRGIIYTFCSILAAYWALAWLVAAHTQKPFDPALLLVNSVILGLSTTTFAILFGSLREGNELDFKEMEALRRTALDLTAELELDQLLEKIIRRAVKLLQASGGGIYRLDPAQGLLTVVADYGTERSIVGYQLKVGSGMAGLVAQTGKWMIKDDYGKWSGRAPGLEPSLFKAVVEVPLEASGSIIGVLYVTSQAEGRRFTPRDARLLSLLASQAAVAMTNAEAFARHRKNIRQLELLNRINERFKSALSFDEILQITLEEALKAVRSDYGSIMILDQNSNELVIRAWVVQGRMVESKDHKRFALGEGIAGHVARTGQPYICPDTARDEHFLESFTGRAIGSLISVPIALHECVFCIINSDHGKPKYFDDGDVELLSALAVNVASAIESQKLRDIGIALSTLPLEHLYPQIVESACVLTGSQVSTIFLVDEPAVAIRQAALYPPTTVSRAEGARDHGLTRHILETGQLVNISDVQQNPLVKQEVKERNTQSLIGAPLVVSVGREGEGHSLKTIGVLFVSTTHARRYGKRDCEVLQSLANQTAIAIERNRNLNELRTKMRFNESLLASAFDAILAVDAEETVLAYNPSAERILGYAQEEVVGHPAARFFEDPADAKKVRKLLKMHGEVVDLNLHIKNKAGESIPILLSAARLEGGSVGFFRDLRAIESAKRHLKQLTELFEASQELVSADNRAAVIQTAAHLTSKTLGADLVSIYSYDREQDKILLPPLRLGELNAPAGDEPDPTPPVRKVIEHGDIYFTDDVQHDELLVGDLVKREQMLSTVACPLKVGDKLIGVIFCGYRKTRHFTDEEKVMARLFFSGVAVAIENARLYGEDKKSARIMQSLYRAGVVTTAGLPPEVSLQSLLEQARELTNAKYGALEILPTELSPEPFFTVSGVEEPLREKIGAPPTGRGMLGRLFEPDTVLNLRDLRSSGNHMGFPEHHPHMTSFLGVSIALNGRGIGNLYVANKQEAARFSKYDEAYLSMLAGQAAAVVERSKSQAEVRAVQTINIAFSLLSRWARTARQQTAALRGKLQELKKTYSKEHAALQEISQIIKRLDSTEDVTPYNHKGGLYESVNLSLLLKEVALKSEFRKRLHEAASAAGVTEPVNPRLEIESNCWVKGSQQLLESALTIILENAVEAIEEKKAKPIDIKVVCGLDTKDAKVHIRVADTGVGVPVQVRQDLFRIPLDSKEGRFGYGSFTAGMIFRLHQGDVRIVSTGQDGTEVACWLPAER